LPEKKGEGKKKNKFPASVKRETRCLRPRRRTNVGKKREGKGGKIVPKRKKREGKTRLLSFFFARAAKEKKKKGGNRTLKGRKKGSAPFLS